MMNLIFVQKFKWLEDISLAMLQNIKWDFLSSFANSMSTKTAMKMHYAHIEHIDASTSIFITPMS